MKFSFVFVILAVVLFFYIGGIFPFGTIGIRNVGTTLCTPRDVELGINDCDLLSVGGNRFVEGILPYGEWSGVLVVKPVETISGCIRPLIDIVLTTPETLDYASIVSSFTVEPSVPTAYDEFAIVFRVFHPELTGIYNAQLTYYDCDDNIIETLNYDYAYGDVIPEPEPPLPDPDPEPVDDEVDEVGIIFITIGALLISVAGLFLINREVIKK